MISSRPRVLIDGREPLAAELEHVALVNYGHFTAMQVRDGAVRGLTLHLTRLSAAHTELFGTVLELGSVRQHMKTAVADAADSYLRVTLFEAEPGSPRVMTTIRPPVEVDSEPLTLLPVTFVRPLAHIKSTGTFAQLAFGEQAERAGFEDALFIAPDGFIAETTIANIGFVHERTLVWPTAPALHGITRQLIDSVAEKANLRVDESPVNLTEIGRYDAAFAANSIGITPIARIAANLFDPENSVIREVAAAYRTVPWEAI